MNKKNYLGLLIVVSLLILVSGCQKKEEETPSGSVISSYSADDYQTLLPHQISAARYFKGNSNSRFDMIEVPKGLIELSKQHFSVKDHYLQSGQILNKDDILLLQSFESQEKPYGMNPASSFEATDVITLERPYLVYGISELDFVSTDNNHKLKGISVAVMMNQIVANGESTVTIPTDRLYAYGTTVSRRLERYLRTKSDVDADLPIYITLYSSAGADSEIPGTFIGEGLFTGRSGQFNTVNEQWVLIPSDGATQYDGVLSSQFATVKSGLKDFMPENVSIIGKARYLNEQAIQLKLTVTVQAKSYTEIYSLMQLLNELSTNFSSSDLDLTIELKQVEETVMILSRPQGSMKTTIIDLS